MSSLISFQLEDAQKQGIAVTDNHYDISSHRSICFYFDQMKAVCYCEVSEDQMNATIEELSRKVLQRHIQIFHDQVGLNQKEISFIAQRKIKKKLQNSTIVSVEINRYEIIVVSFPDLLSLMSIHAKEPQIKIKIPLGKVGHNQVQVDFTSHKKFKIRELLLFYQIQNYGHSGLRVRGKIVKYIEHLSKLHDSLISMKEDSFSGTLVYSYQIFYEQIRQIRKFMNHNSLDLVRSLCKTNDQWIQLQNRAKQISSPMQQITKYVILYLTSPFFDPLEQTEYFKRYFNGKINFSHEDLETQKMSLLVHHILQLHSHQTDSEIIYLSQVVDETFNKIFSDKSIVKFQTFLSCHSNRSKLHFPSGKSSIVYKIQSVSAKSVGIINFKIDGPDYICLPYTEYYVETSKKIGSILEVSLIEMPIPKYFDKNLVIWVDSKIKQARGLNLPQRLRREVDLEIIILKDNTLFEFWLKRYNSTTNNRKIGVISNMVRESDATSGITTLRIAQQYLGKVPFLFYIGDIHKCKQCLMKNKIDLEDNSITVTNRQEHLIQYLQLFSQFINGADYMEYKETCCGKQQCEVM